MVSWSHLLHAWGLPPGDHKTGIRRSLCQSPSLAQPEDLLKPVACQSSAPESAHRRSLFSASLPPLPPRPSSPTKLCFLLSHRGAARMPLATRAKKAFLI